MLIKIFQLGKKIKYIIRISYKTGQNPIVGAYNIWVRLFIALTSKIGTICSHTIRIFNCIYIYRHYIWNHI